MTRRIAGQLGALSVAVNSGLLGKKFCSGISGTWHYPIICGRVRSSLRCRKQAPFYNVDWRRSAHRLHEN
jgi:hypothetical protein